MAHGLLVFQGILGELLVMQLNCGALRMDWHYAAI